MDREALERLCAGADVMRAQERKREVEALFDTLANDPALGGVNVRRLAERLHLRGVRAKEDGR